MSKTDHNDLEARDGAPLAVCINDCQLDYGQPGPELMGICFHVGCAFAEMRWGRSAATSLRLISLGIHEKEASGASPTATGSSA